ncbi:A/G-specific adenine glycosylase [Candidatus Marinamargulisbacteria bacterium SCGC AG-343-D04]|nr:A/G-specific adenine glycosylase [Candidatus Marinamargulisbacteria bacterium SCGC AG-343-D04]
MNSGWVSTLLSWYHSNKRSMPWRDNPIPYYVWISEMMLQQTQVATVIPYFNRFIDRFPTVEKLAEADLQDVLKCWEGLGYYSRARNLHKAAKCVVEDHQSWLPSSYEDLQTLPGIGPYCAAAITSIAYQNPVPVVDGNVFRVFTRFWGIFDDIRLPKVRKVLFEKLSVYIKDVCPSDFNQAIMECGALVCTPKNPSCEECPLACDCFAKSAHKQVELPVKLKAPPTPHHTIVVGLIKHGDKVLIAKRKETQMLGGLWEFPGGKVEKGEALEEALSREIQEEVRLTVSVGDKIGVIKHAYSHFKISMHAFWCEVESGLENLVLSKSLKWVKVSDFSDYPFPKANQKLFDCLSFSSQKMSTK